MPTLDLSVSFCGLTLKNPLVAASGTFGYGDELPGLLPADRFGAVCLKGLTLKPRQGNPPPRIAETPSGILNAIGLQNIGVERFLAEKAPCLRGLDTVVIANIAGESVEENRDILAALDPEPSVHAFELNVSCPNVRRGGMAFGTDPAALAELLSDLRPLTRKPLIVKLPPHVPDIAGLARICHAEGADAVSAINTIPAMVIDIERRRPLLGNATGGLSGPAIRPVGVRAVWQIRSAVPLPVIGCGGVLKSSDAIEYLLAGASAVQIGTALFTAASTVDHILAGLKAYMNRHHFASLTELVGAARNP